MARAKQAAPGGRLSKDTHAAMTKGQLTKAMADLERSVRDTHRELQATDSRLQALEAQREELQGAAAEADQACGDLRAREQVLQAELSQALANKYKLLLATSRQQKQAKRFEDMASGRYRPLVEDASLLDGEVTAAGGRLEALLGVCSAIREAVPQLAGELDKVLCHVTEV